MTVGLSYCSDLHDILPMECRCLFEGSDEDRFHFVQLYRLMLYRLYIDETITEFGKRIVEISNDWQSQNLTDFAVVYQPFTVGSKTLQFLD